MPYVDRVVIAVPPNAQARVRQLIEQLAVLPNEVMLFIDQGAGRPRRCAVADRRGAAGARLRRPEQRAPGAGEARAGPDRRLAGARPRPAADGADRAGHQARQPRPGVLPPAPARLQQRGDPGLEVPLDARRLRRRHRQRAR